MKFDESCALCVNCLHKYKCKKGEDINPDNCIVNIVKREQLKTSKFPRAFSYVHNAKT